VETAAVAACDGRVEGSAVAPEFVVVAGACEATAVVALGEVAVVAELLAAIIANCDCVAELLAAIIANCDCVDELPPALTVAVAAELGAAAVVACDCVDELPAVNAAGPCAALAEVVLTGMVVPAEPSATATSADFMSRGSSAWNESERKRPPPRTRAEEDDLAEVFAESRCQLKNLRIVSP
jgi:hypothetical protein